MRTKLCTSLCSKAAPILLLLLALGACRPKGEDLLGRWHIEASRWETPEEAEFFVDQTCFIDHHEVGFHARLSCTWSQVGQNRFKIDASALGTRITLFATINEGKLTLDDQGKSTVWSLAAPEGEESQATAASSTGDTEARAKTRSEMTTLGAAMLAWIEDHEARVSPQRSIKVDLYPPITARRLGTLLVPQYVQQVPEVDGWGHAYEYYLETTDFQSTALMAIRSPGPDGRFDASTYSQASPPQGDDLVWAEGDFVRSP